MIKQLAIAGVAALALGGCALYEDAADKAAKLVVKAGNYICENKDPELAARLEERWNARLDEHGAKFDQRTDCDEDKDEAE